VAIHQQAEQPRSAFQPIERLLHPEVHAAATPATSGVSGVTAPQQAPRLNIDPSVFGHMSDFLTLGGVPVASTTGPANGQVTAPVTTPAGPQTATTGEAQANAPAPPTVAAYGATLDTQLASAIMANRRTRATLDQERTSGAATADATETGLNTNRQALLDQLNQRSGVFDQSIAAIDAQLGGTTPRRPTPVQQELINQRAQLLTNRNRFADQQTTLSRWHDRNEINNINTQLADTTLTAEQRTALLANKRTLATGLLSTVKHYEQFDPQWGGNTYGPDSRYSTMREGGCGPTALADIMDFHDQEDPEGRHSQGEHDPYDPMVMARYASRHGRVLGNGTAGQTMMGDLNGSFPQVRGNALGSGNPTAARESLDNGIPVLFSGSNLHGTMANGQDTRYGAHYMVLSGVSADGQTYNVTDGGRNSTRNIRTMSRGQVDDVGNMFNIQSAHPRVAPANS
jgi:hypothetical protein